MFLVVELSSSSDVVVVPDSWTTGHRSSTWWPPYQTPLQLNKAVRCKEAPGEGWGSKAIKTIQVADSYNKARRKVMEGGRQAAGSVGGVTLRRSERLKRALSQHTQVKEAEEGTPHPKRRRTCTTRTPSDALRAGTPVRVPPAPPPPPPRTTRRTHLPPPPTLRRTGHAHPPPPPPPPPLRRSRRTRLPPPPPLARRTRHSRPSPALLSSPRPLNILEKLHKSLNRQLRFLIMLFRLLNALKKYMKKYLMLQQVLAKLPGLMEGIMDQISTVDRVPHMERITDLVMDETIRFDIVVYEIIRFVLREAERDEEEEEEDDEEDDEDEDEEEQTSIIREE